MSEDVEISTDQGPLVFTQALAGEVMTEFEVKIPMMPPQFRDAENFQVGVVCGILGKVKGLSVAQTAELMYFNDEFMSLATEIVRTLREMADMRRKASLS